MTLSAERFNNYFLIGNEDDSSASFKFLKVNDTNLVKISIKIYVRLNGRKLSIIFCALEGGR